MRYFQAILFIICASCGGGISNYTEELSGGFTYVNFGGSLNTIESYSRPFPGIYGEVTDFVYDNNFIIVLQHPSKEGYQSKISSKLRNENHKLYPTNSGNDRSKTDLIADSIIISDPFYQKIFEHKINYWIISHNHKKMYGPLTEKEYLAKRRELKVPNDLQLKEDTTQLN